MQRTSAGGGKGDLKNVQTIFMNVIIKAQFPFLLKARILKNNQPRGSQPVLALPP
jgi:hypothetical protein